MVEAEGRRGRLLASDDAIELELREPAAGLAAGEHRLFAGDAGPQAPFEVGEPSSVLAAFVHALQGDAAAASLLDPLRALREMHRAVAPGGRAVACETDFGTRAVDIDDLELANLVYGHGGAGPRNRYMGRQIHRRFHRAGVREGASHTPRSPTRSGELEPQA